MSNTKILRIEPPNWWENMKLETLQILMYGPDLASYQVNASSGINITEVTRTGNPNYLFVSVASATLKAGNYTFSLYKKGSEDIVQNYTVEKRKKDSSLRKGFDTSDLIYLLMPDRFSNGDPTLDSHQDVTEKADRMNLGGRHGGDIKGIINHLDYLQELGITALWSTPLCEDNDPSYSYHGYAQSDVYKIDPRFGTNEDYKFLAEELHKRDIKLIHDYVTNHWGSQHWIIKDLPTPDWINQFDEYTNTNHRMTTQFDPYVTAIDKKIYTDGWFVPTMPDLNQNNLLVLNYLTQNAIWWIEYADIDSLRVDTYSYNHKEGISKWTQNIMREYPNFNIVGEVWLHDSAQIAYWQKDSKIGELQDFNSHLPTLMDFTLNDAIHKIFPENKHNIPDINLVYENLVNDFFYPNPQNLLVFLDNHDIQRFNTLAKGNFNFYKLAMTLICTTRGIPQIYYGSEIGMQGNKDNGDGDIRHEFPGGWEGDLKSAFLPKNSKNGRNAYQEKFFNFSKKLFNWRKGNSVIHYGKLLHYIPENNVYVYFRYTSEERVMIVLNLNDKLQQLDLIRFAEGLAGHTVGTEILSDKILGLTGTLRVTAKTPLIITLN